MITISPYFTQFLQYFSIFSWKDALEILFFTWLIYRFSLWLKENQTSYLLQIFYNGSLIIIASYFFNFATMNAFFIVYGPACLMLFILMHQKALQENFVTMKKIKPLTKQQENNWLEVLIRTCLRTQNTQKSFLCIIEQSEDLSFLLEAPFLMKNNITKDLLVLLLESPHLNPEKLVWLSHDGTINSINAFWKNPIDATWLADNVKHQESWIANALIITEKTDALVFKSNAQTNTFDIVAQGKLVENLSATNALRIIRHYLNINPLSAHKKGDLLYEKSQHKKSSLEQSNH